jgi:serralysin
LGAINLTGNEFAQSVIGNAGVNTLYGGGGDDTLNGFAGNDTLDGGTGDDKMYGGLGNDKYRVGSAGDRVVEAVGQGVDTIYASVSYDLRAGTEVEYLRASDPAATTAINLGGNEFNQTIVGNAGANVLNGGGGDDGLVGGGGVDTFVINNLGGTDRITDFLNGVDKIDLRGLDANAALSGDQAFTFIGDSAFSGAAGQLRTYVSGSVNYAAGDVNGDGIADFVINLGSVHTVGSDYLL